jgi:hypothetical protein
MTETNETPKIPKTTSNPPRNSVIGKRWKMVKNSTHANNHADFVRTKMSQFQFVLKEVKQLSFIQEQPYFCRDYKDDGSEPFLIHSFVSETFAWRIECNLLFEIVIEYCIENCPIELDIWAIIKSNQLHHYATPITKQPSLAAHYKAVLAYQDPRYITKP